MTRPVLLDLFCGAGGCAVGYHRAGFDVVGVDVEPQPNYPFAFVRADALKPPFDLRDFDAVHASPPCQRYSASTRMNGSDKAVDHPDLVAPTRLPVDSTGRPWVIENVPGAPLGPAIVLCGSMFGLPVRRHRVFESSVLLFARSCMHGDQQGDYPAGNTRASVRIGRKMRSKVVKVYGEGGSKGSHALWSRAMGIGWMTKGEMAQAIPPAYCEFVGRQLLRALGREPA